MHGESYLFSSKLGRVRVYSYHIHTYVRDMHTNQLFNLVPTVLLVSTFARPHRTKFSLYMYMYIIFYTHVYIISPGSGWRDASCRSANARTVLNLTS